MSKLIEREIFVEAPWGKVAVLAWGERGGRPVLLCHGRLDSAATFRPLVGMLPSQFYYIGLELPGNGKSDHLRRGVKYSMFDLLPTIHEVVEHFQLESFTYIGHSLGALIGKYYNIVYPGRLKACVELDPLPAYITTEHESMKQWYHSIYGRYYSRDGYAKHSGEGAPVYSREQAVELIMENRAIHREAADTVLERTLNKVGPDQYTFAFDQRMKWVAYPPVPKDQQALLYTSTDVPTLCVLARRTIDDGWYDNSEYLYRPDRWTAEYRFVIVEGGHDVHLTNPERVSGVVGAFLR